MQACVHSQQAEGLVERARAFAAMEQEVGNEAHCRIVPIDVVA
jgi:hypothetical protein